MNAHIHPIGAESQEVDTRLLHTMVRSRLRVGVGANHDRARREIGGDHGGDVHNCCVAIPPTLLTAMAPVQAEWRALVTLAPTHGHRRARALGNNLLRQWVPLRAFLTHERVEPTNNRAERFIQPTVLIRKTIGAGSEVAKAFVANLEKVLVIARWQWIDAFTWLEYIFTADLSGEFRSLRAD